MLRYAFLGSLALTACGHDIGQVGADATGPTPDSPPGTVTITGTIGSDQTWAGALAIIGPTTIASGVKVIVSSGAHVTATTNATVTVEGTLDMEGTRTEHVAIVPSSITWGGFDVIGQLTMHYTDQTGGGIVVDGGSVTVTDAAFSHDRDGRDFLIVHSGTVDIAYSAFQPAAGTNDLVHCDMHANQGGASMIKVVHTNLSNATYGFDFFGGTADLTYDNWFSNSTDVYTEAGSPVTADVSFGWFQNGGPTAAPGSTITANSLATAKLPDAGPRP